MDEYLIGSVIPLEDEEGNEIEFTVLDALEYEGVRYLALEKANIPLDEPSELLIMKHDPEDEDVLLAVDAWDDEEEYDMMYQIFCERMDEDWEEEGEEEDGE